MTALSAFTPEDQDILLTTPYLVGMWISTIDDDEGEGDDRAERARLKQVLLMLAKRHVAQPLVADVFTHLSDALDHRRFPDDTDKAIEMSVAAVRTILAVVGPVEAKAYAGALLEVASAVARAANESAGYEGAHMDEEGMVARITAQAGALWSRVASTLNTERNISPAEDTALTELTSALRAVLGHTPQVAVSH